VNVSNVDTWLIAKMKILLVDDHILFREGLATLLDAQPDMTIVAEAASAREAVVKAGELEPDTILMDISMPCGTGLEAACKILSEQPELNIVFLTVDEDDDRLFEAVKSWAKGYLLKNMRTAELVEMLRGLERGEAAFSKGLAVRILNEFARMKNRLDASEPIDEEEVTLTNREVEILELAAAGASNREIASQLVVTKSTVKNHMRNILGKLHLKNRREAVAFARRQGLIDPPQN